MSRSLNRADAVQIITGLRADLDRTLDEIDEQRTIANISAQHQGYLNDYGMVRMAGYLEQLCFHAISGRIGEVSSGMVQEFIGSWFHKSPNLTAGQFRDLFKRFGPVIDGEVQDFLNMNLHRELLNSLLERRNAVAHGKEQSQTGMQALSTYRSLVDDIDTFVHNLLLSNTSRI